MAIATIAAIAGTAVSSGTSIYQLIRANQFEEQAGERPRYAIPEAEKESLNLARKRARGDMPGYDQTMQTIEESTAMGMDKIEQAAASSSDLLGMLPSIIAGEQRAKRDLGINNAEFRNQVERELMQKLGEHAAYQDKAWQINEMDPFLENSAAASSLRGAAMQNLNAGFNHLAENLVNRESVNYLRDVSNDGDVVDEFLAELGLNRDDIANIKSSGLDNNSGMQALDLGEFLSWLKKIFGEKTDSELAENIDEGQSMADALNILNTA